MCTVTAMNYPDIHSRLATDGYVVIEDFLSETRCDVMRQALARHKPEPRKSLVISGYDTACDVFGGDPLSAGDVDFIALHQDPALHTVTDAAIGEGWVGPRSLVFWSTAGGRGQAWHQDCRADGDRFNLNRLFYTSDVQRDDGAVVVVPGSHRRGRISATDAQEDIPRQVVLTPRKGTLVLLNGLCWHRVTPNQSGRERVSINLRAFPVGTPTDWTKIGVYRDADVEFGTAMVTKRETVATQLG
jgi:ectoine hydroxylase-related dioxygenase (phytanoyl-CoA dioxygenase family)